MTCFFAVVIRKRGRKTILEINFSGTFNRQAYFQVYNVLLTSNHMITLVQLLDKKFSDYKLHHPTGLCDFVSLKNLLVPNCSKLYSRLLCDYPFMTPPDLCLKQFNNMHGLIQRTRCLLNFPVHFSLKQSKVKKG